METLSSAGKHVTRAKRGKSCNCCHARENMKPVSSAGKHSTGINMRGKTWKSCQGRENMNPVSSAGNHATGVKRGKTCNRCYAREFARKLIRIDVDVAFDWLKNSVFLVTVLARVFCTNHKALLTLTKAETFARTQDSTIKLKLLSTHVLIISLSDFKYAKERPEMGK